MQNVELAKRRLKDRGFNLVVAKAGRIVFETRLQGMKGLLVAIERVGKELSGSSVADKVVGRAAAMLCVYSQVSHVFAVILSEEGKHVLQKNNLFYEYEKLVPQILNKNEDDVCPFEKLVAEIKNPEEVYRRLLLFLSGVQ